MSKYSASHAELVESYLSQQLPDQLDEQSPEEVLAALGLTGLTQAMWAGGNDCIAAFEADQEAHDSVYSR